MESFITKQKKIYDDLNIISYSVMLKATGFDVDYPDRIKKEISRLPKYKDIKLESHFNSLMNSLMIPTGKEYNLILIDIDNKDDTMDKYNKICKANEYNDKTLTESTMNKGLHFYYKLSKKQKIELDTIDFKSKDGKMFNLHIDVKYTNQFSSGASYIEYNNKKYKTEIINYAYPATLPDFIFDEILRVSKRTEKAPKEEAPAEKAPVIEVPKSKPITTKQNVNYDEIKMILDKLPPNYYNERDEWRNIGLALGSTKDERLRELYYLFSSKSPKYTGEKDCDNFFNMSDGSMSDDSITLGTLYQYAKVAGIEIKRCIDEIEPNYKEFDHYLDFFNHYKSNQFKNINNFIKEITKYVKFALTKSIYIVKIGYNEFDFIKSKSFEVNLSKYKYKKVVYVKGEKRTKDDTIMSLINDNIELFTVHDIIFKPNDDNPKNYNLFKGFKSNKVESFDIKVIEPVLKHIKEVWANGSDTIYKYIVNWLASIIQKPDVKTEVALVFISNEGAGKNIIFDFLQKYIFGQYAVNVPDMDKIVCRFNNTLSNKLLTLLNEANQVDGNYNKAWDTMKNLITEKKQIIEKKGIDSFEIDDYNNYMFFSNNSNPVKISGRDRRYMINSCSNKYVGNKEYFTELNSLLDQNSANHLYTYLLSYKLFNLRDIPNTDARTEQKINSLSAVNKWLFHKSYDVTNTVTNIPTLDLYSLYVDDCTREGFVKLNQINFSKDLKKVIEFKSLWIDKKAVKMFIFDIDRIKKYFKAEFNIDLVE
jgi:hypothetical protein